MILLTLYLCYFFQGQSQTCQSDTGACTPGGRPATTIQYDELMEAVGSERMNRIFWPVVCPWDPKMRRFDLFWPKNEDVALCQDPMVSLWKALRHEWLFRSLLDFGVAVVLQIQLQLPNSSKFCAIPVYWLKDLLAQEFGVASATFMVPR